MNGDHCKIYTALCDLRFNVSDEATMQAAMAQALTDYGVKFNKEWDAKPCGRLDFYCEGVAVELKIKGSKAAVQRQLERYAKHPKIESIILVSTKRQLCFMPHSYNGKTISTIYCGSPF